MFIQTEMGFVKMRTARLSIPCCNVIGNVIKGSTLYSTGKTKASNWQREEKDILMKASIKMKGSYEKWFRRSEYQRKFGTQQCLCVKAAQIGFPIYSLCIESIWLFQEGIYWRAEGKQPDFSFLPLALPQIGFSVVNYLRVINTPLERKL